MVRRRRPGPVRAAAMATLLVPCAAGVPTAAYVMGPKYLHQKLCFTEGLFLRPGSQEHEVYESCGLTGRSFVRRYSLRNGETLQFAPVPREFFGEGIALLGGALYLLTYQHSVVLEYDAATFKEKRRHQFPYGEGWGLTTDGCDLLATTGSEFIYRLHPDASGELALVSKVKVTHEGMSVQNLNELEYVTPKLWVNQWHTNQLWRVDPLTGVCELQVDISGLHRWFGEATPNGIAYSHSLDASSLLVTGKMWPSIFTLQLAPGDLCGAKPGAPAPAAPQCAAAPPSACWTGVEASTAAPAAPAAAAAASGASPVQGAAVAGLGPEGSSTAVPPAGPLPGPQAPGLASEDLEALAPLPLLVTVASTAASLALAAAAVAAPLWLWSYRHHYKTALPRGDVGSGT